MRIHCYVLLAIVWSYSLVAAQQPGKVSEDQVSEILAYLASDDLMGRDTGSAGLKVAQDWSQKRFQDCGLQPGMPDGTWFFDYELPGRKLALPDCQASLRVGAKSLQLAPVTDFRFLSASVAYAYEDTVAARMSEADAVAKGLMMRGRLDAPVIVEVDPESLLWLGAEKGEWVGKRRDLGAAILLVRRGLIPPGKIKLTLTTPEPVSTAVKERNVVGLLKGRTKPDEFVLVTAHLDHLGVGLPQGKDQDDCIYNGANDNGTGSTAVIELGRICAEIPEQERPERSLLFILFSGEERGLLGSRAMAKNSPWPLEKIVVQVNLEMLGRPEKGKRNMAWVTGAKHSDFEAIARTAMKRAGVTMTTFVMAEQLYAASDNWPYAEKGVVAHSISASGIRGINYHEPKDEFDRIDLKHMTKVIEGLAEVVLEFANREAVPQRIP